MEKTKHTHPVAFGRKVDGCARCEELRLGALPRRWRGYSANDVQRIQEIRAHNCQTSRCGPVCTFGDY